MFATTNAEIPIFTHHEKVSRPCLISDPSAIAKDRSGGHQRRVPAAEIGAVSRQAPNGGSERGTRPARHAVTFTGAGFGGRGREKARSNQVLYSVVRGLSRFLLAVDMIESIPGGMIYVTRVGRDCL